MYQRFFQYFLSSIIFLNILNAECEKDMHEKIISAYSSDYCLLLETIYGAGMMSEGESEAIEHMFFGISLEEKKALDFGSGLGGTSLYLSDTYNMDITGLDINPWLISEASNKISTHLQSTLRYKLNTSDDSLNFPDNTFDIIYSKESLMHVKNKINLFKEFKRILKPDGKLVIIDPINCIAKMSACDGADSNGSTFFTVMLERYIQLLKNAGFSEIKIDDYSDAYKNYNKEVCEGLRNQKKEKLIKLLGYEKYLNNLKMYQSIVQAINEKKLYFIRFVATINP